MKKISLLIFLFFGLTAVWAQTPSVKREVVGRDIGQLKGIKLSGRITDEITGEALVGATVRIPELDLTRITDDNGSFELEVSRAEYTLEFRYVGYETRIYPITAVGDGRITIRMLQEDFTLDDVVIYGSDPEKNILAYKTPLGLGLLGKKVGDSVKVKIGASEENYTVKSIGRYIDSI